MRSRIVSVLLLSLLTLFAIAMIGCGKATDPTMDFTYPLAVGNHWEYSITYTATNIRGDSAAVVDALSGVSIGASDLDILYYDTLTEGIPSYVLVSSVEFGGGARVDSGYTYLNNEPDGLYIYASDQRFGITLHKPGIPEYTLHHGSRSFASFEDFLCQSAKEVPTMYAADGNPPVYDVYYQTLAYPLAIGRNWTARTEDIYSFTNKSIIGFGDITVPAGTFSCYAVKSDLILVDGLDYVTPSIRVDYYSSKGMIKRTITGYDLTIVSEDNTWIGTADITTEYKLTSFMLK
ncbi:MAG: hypothetical protein R3F48_01690 [Candidatus Zixiibacteriota bacterium]